MIRRLLKWAGSAASLLLLAAWLVSGTRGLQLEGSRGNGVCFVAGWCTIRWGVTAENAQIAKKAGYHIGGIAMVQPRFGRLEWAWRPWLANSVGVTVPGWYPIGLIGPFTALFWWLDRRRLRPGQCSGCGYDLTGNISGTCPECGQAIAAKSPSA